MKLPVLFFFALVFSFAVHAQEPAKWMRVQSEDGVFSVEVPAEHTYFFDKDGFSLRASFADFELRNVGLLSAYLNGTLLTVEAYKSSGRALDALFETSIPQGASGQSITFNGLSGKRFEHRADSHYLVSYYVRSKEWVYVVSSASRTGETPDMKQFLQSMRVDPKATEPNVNAVRFSSLERTKVNLKTKDVKPAPPRVPDIAKAEPDPGVKPVIILSRSRASFTDAARERGITGAVTFRLNLSERGTILPDIEAIDTLDGGLVRQCLFAALRMKFLPKEKDGRPISTVVTLEYTFNVY